MSFRINLFSNYFAKIYTAVLAVVVVPFYIKLLGLESYGVIGFYLVLMALMQLLDVGLSSTLSRQVALVMAGKIDRYLIQYTLKLVFLSFVVVGALFALLFWSASGFLSEVWFVSDSIDLSVLQSVIAAIGLAVSLRWLCGPLRSVLVGSESLLKLNFVVVLVASLRYLLVIPVIHYFSDLGFNSLIVYFSFQVLVATFEFAALFFFAHRILSFVSAQKPDNFWLKAKPICLFALTVAASSWMWVVIMQLDKLALSKFLSLKMFGAFTAAMAVASAVQMLSAPLVQAIMPRLAKLYGQGGGEEYLDFFDKCARKYTIYFSSIPCFIAYFSKDILLAWTGDTYVAGYASVTLSLYTLAFWLVSIASFYYYLQHSSGSLWLHNRILLCMFLYTLFVVSSAAYFGGGRASGIAWLVLASLYLVLGGYFVMRNFHKKNISRWLFDVTLPYIFIPLTIFYVAYFAYQQGLVSGISVGGVSLDLFFYFFTTSSFSTIISLLYERARATCVC